MSYWGPCTGVALLLNKSEINTFIKNYLTKTYYPEATDEDVANFHTAIDEQIFLLSGKHLNITLKQFPTLKNTYHIASETFKSLPKNSVFVIDKYDSEGNVGAFYPFVEHKDKKHPYTTIYDNMYVIWCNKSVLPQDIITGKSYTSLDEIISEFKDKVATYLPENFDWNQHIGFYEYAIFA